jgi:hypothetical protein
MNYLKYAEKEYPIVIDMGTILNYCESMDIDFTEYEKTLMKPKNLKVFFKESLKRGFYKEKKEFNLSDAECLDILAENMDFFSAVKNKATIVEQDSKKND